MVEMDKYIEKSRLFCISFGVLCELLEPWEQIIIKSEIFAFICYRISAAGEQHKLLGRATLLNLRFFSLILDN